MERGTVKRLEVWKKEYLKPNPMKKRMTHLLHETSYIKLDTLCDECTKLTVYPQRTVFLTGQPMANITDHTSLYNIVPFGKCRPTSYPSTGSATAANHGRLTPMPCIPGTNSNWINGKDDYIVKGSPALLKSSYCRCCYGGVITITDDGQK